MSFKKIIKRRKAISVIEKNRKLFIKDLPNEVVSQIFLFLPLIDFAKSWLTTLCKECRKEVFFSLGISPYIPQTVLFISLKIQLPIKMCCFNCCYYKSSTCLCGFKFPSSILDDIKPPFKRGPRDDIIDLLKLHKVYIEEIH